VAEADKDRAIAAETAERAALMARAALIIASIAAAIAILGLFLPI